MKAPTLDGVAALGLHAAESGVRAHVSGVRVPQDYQKSQSHSLGAETRLQWFAVLLVFMGALSSIIALAFYRYEGQGWPLGLYSVLLLTYLIVKMTLAFRYRPIDSEHPDTLRISVVIPNYNEAPDALADTIHSLMRQSRVPDEVFVVDDGSPDPAAYEMALALCRQYPNLVVHRMEKNVGKRRAQGWAFRRLTGDLILTVDSDTVYDPHSVEAMIAPFLADTGVTAVGGQIRARNRTDNMLTRLLDMRYHNAYRVERAAQSASGAMLCCSGPIAMYRREIVMDNLHDYENQRFLGEIVTAGDDRRLTQYALKRGKVVYQGRATCETTIPSSLRVFVKQQVRWTKSFFRESGESLKFALEMRRASLLYWTLLELSLWAVFTLSVLYGLASGKFLHQPLLLWVALAYVALAAYARNVFYLFRHPLVFLLAPVYGLFHLVVLFPVRLYALVNLKNTGWGTR